MKKITGQQIRELWLKFFKEKGHAQIESSSLIPHGDPTLLWINSGVAALKDYFDGTTIPSNRRLVNVQKSIRTNDIENVGYTARHHTFFEMLGNFSIGDYFRQEMVPWAIELLTSPDYYDMPLDKLYFTYHPSDLDTYNTWIKAGVDQSHLIPLEGNYWEIGEGPAGPNTEVFFDRGPKYDPENKGIELLKEDIDNDRYVEIWGIVFSQFNAKKGVKREDYEQLPFKNIDTGAGLERIACVLQDTPTNFETDLFMPIIKELEQISQVKYEENLMAFRVIADHIRALTFALSDGATFANEGRGYVLRRLLRRAMRFGQKINIEEPFLSDLVDIVVSKYEGFYPTVALNVNNIKKTINDEEVRFISTLKSGETLLQSVLEKSKNVSGDDAFKLYDTYGFPFDLTKEIVLEQGGSVDEERFNQLLEEQRIRARSARVDAASMATQSGDLLNFTSESTFLYNNLNEIKTKVIGLFKDGEKVGSLQESGEIVVETTNFYAESGGQVGDEGVISGENFNARVIDTKLAPNGQHLHFVEVEGEVKLGDEVRLNLDVNRRLLIMRNHSVTHLLNAVLEEVLETNIKQEGSYVGPTHLRFDINYNGRISNKKLRKIEERVNELISVSLPQKTQILSLEEAKATGAKSLFDEKYEDTVRVVSFGDFSSEFCGGTHVNNSNEIGVFAIVGERAVAAGVRRIEAKTSLGAYELLKEKNDLLHIAQKLIGASSQGDVVANIKQRLSEKEELRKKIRQLEDIIAVFEAKKLQDEFKEINGISYLFKHFKATSRQEIGRIIDELKGTYDASVIVLSGEENGNLPLVVYVSKGAHAKGFKAGDIVREVASLLGGSGGGRFDFASGAGRNKDKLGEVARLLEQLLNE